MNVKLNGRHIWECSLLHTRASSLCHLNVLCSYHKNLEIKLSCLSRKKKILVNKNCLVCNKYKKMWVVSIRRVGEKTTY